MENTADSTDVSAGLHVNLINSSQQHHVATENSGLLIDKKHSKLYITAFFLIKKTISFKLIFY